MKEDESVSDIFHQMEVLVNDLKALGEKVEDKYFSYKFLRCCNTPGVCHQLSNGFKLNIDMLSGDGDVRSNL